MPDFDDLVGGDVEGGERERLRRVHELLLDAGPPPELPPHLESGPTLGMTLGRSRRSPRSRVALLAAAICLLAVAFVLGYLAGNRGGGIAHATTLRLTGTKMAPGALASLRVLPADTAGNWPMKLAATGLPKLGSEGYYEVFLMRDGKLYAPCGAFVGKGPNTAVDVSLNSPYSPKAHDTWVVTMHKRGMTGPGPIVLRPAKA